jgi:NhaA family Na+:H+ antiporter
MAKQGKRAPVSAIGNTLQQFIQTESSGGLVLIATAIVAIAWANSAWAYQYFALWEKQLGLHLGDWALSKTLGHWVNDGLMAVFFLLVGLEIKREIVSGELSTLRQAVLPISTAVGGMLLPALIYLALNAGGAGSRGWGIPMATDIAFALAVLLLAGKAVPAGLKVLLTALAIVDDLGAVIVIALFYTDHIAGGALLAAGAIVLVLLALNQAGVRWLPIYLALGVLLWLAVLKSGVHATIAGVVLAFFIPIRSRMQVDAFTTQAYADLDAVRERSMRHAAGKGALLHEEQAAALHHLQQAAAKAQPLVHRLEHSLKGFVAWLVMPLFALANAGLALGTTDVTQLAHPVSLGIVLGLVLGKQLGIVLFAWLSLRLGWAQMPAGVTWPMVLAVGVLGGIGFTMSLFVAQLAFTDATLLNTAKMGVLTATLISGIAGYFILRRALRSSAASANG